jgi:aminoglycoside phosphotransferase family enzyme/predicted kinase
MTTRADMGSVNGAAAHQPWADLHETHSGLVLLMGSQAFKFKKPVDFGFLDFTTLDRRRRACEREVELNQRLCPDVYLGVGTLSGPDGEVVDHVVMMRRMPEDRRLSSLVRSGVDVDAQLRDVARQLASFHTRAERSEQISSDGTAGSLDALWQTSFAEVLSHPDLVPASLEADIESLVQRYLAGRGELFEARVSSGSVLDGHGDLMAEEIFCLDDGPRILDCLEFDDRLRHVDQVDDAAFLAMDLEHLGAPELGARFLDWYAEFSGDNAPVSLAEHYLAYRAYVRAKVACLRHGQGDLAAESEARRFAEATRAHLQRAAVKLVVVGGPPGTGKSTLGAGLADRLGMTLLSSDRVRKELAQISPSVPAEAERGEDIYTGAWTRRVYAEMLRRAAMLLVRGESVVLDATWGNSTHRDLARQVAEDCSADLVQIRCQASSAVADARLASRATVSAAGTVSDATPVIAAGLRVDFARWPDASIVDTNRPVGDTLEGAVTLVRPSDSRAGKNPRPYMEPD